MTAPGSHILPLEEQVRQLNEARKLALNDVSYFPTIVQGILPIIGPSAAQELRRWGAEFLAEAFATPALPSREKESLGLLVLDTIRNMLDDSKGDIFVQRSAVMSASSLYPLVLRWIIDNDYDSATWDRLCGIKSSVFRLWGDAPAPIRICCIKFAQRVVIAQTVAAESHTGSKRDGTDVSLSSIPAHHALLDPRQLEAEATGLLDRMLGVLQENSDDALIVDATLNSLSVLVQTRPATSNRIVNSILNFNPLKLANAPMTPKNRVLVQSMEKTTRVLLIHIAKRDATGNFTGRIQQYVDRLVRSKADIFDSSSRKRGAGEAQSNIAASGDAKRRKLGADAVLAEQALPTPLGPGPHSLAAVYALTKDTSLRGFDASVLPAPLVARMTTALLANLELSSLVRAVEAVRARLALLESAALQPTPLNPDTAPLGVDEDDDDYEPDFYAAEDTEQILNKLDGDGRPLRQLPADYRQADEKSSGNINGTELRNSLADQVDTASDLVLGSFALPAPIRLDPRAASDVGQAVVEHFLGQFQNPDPSILSSLSFASPSRRIESGSAKALKRSSWDRDTWLTLLIRLATRSSAGLEADEAATSPTVKSESALVSAQIRPLAFGDSVRNLLYSYILENFRSRIDVSVAWLCEEWYNDQLVKIRVSSVTAKESSIHQHHLLNYEKWTLRLVDGFLPYLTPQDKVLTRFLGEIPELSPELLDKIRALCSNPDMVNLALTSLLYIVMMRPPARELALDKVAAIHEEFDYAQPMAAKYLARWRPQFLESVNARSALPTASTALAAAT